MRAQGEELLGEVGEPGHVDGELLEDLLVLLDGADAALGQLQAALQERQRSAELVAGVVDEAALVLQRAVLGSQHVVEGVSEPGHLVVAAWGYVEPQPDASGGDLLGAAPVPLDRP